MREILTFQEELIPWAEKVGATKYFPDARAIGWGVRAEGEYPEEKPCAVVVYDRWTDNDVHIHIVSDGTVGFGSRQLIASSFHYPFIMAKRRHVTGLVLANNIHARRLCAQLGFRREGRMRHAGPGGEDIIIFGMLRDECRHIPRAYRGEF